MNIIGEAMHFHITTYIITIVWLFPKILIQIKKKTLINLFYAHDMFFGYISPYSHLKSNSRYLPCTLPDMDSYCTFFHRNLICFVFI